MRAPVRRVVVYGDGIAAAMVALALARAYRRTDVETLWIAPDGAKPADRALIALPDLATFHTLLGIDENALVTHASATLANAQQFAGWSGDQSMFLNGYGDVGSAFASMPFVQHWVRARHSGLRVPLEDFCLAAAAAKQGRIGSTRSAEAIPIAKHGYHLDARRYGDLLAARCAQAGVIRIAGAAKANCAYGAIDRVLLDNGQAIEADLFVDADGALIATLDPDGRTHIRRPYDRMMRASLPALDPLPLFARVAAHRTGWMTLIPLSDRTAVEFAYNGSLVDDASARTALTEAVHGQAGDIQVEPIVDFARDRAWFGNCVAIGAAAGAAPPLDGAELLLLQLAVAQLVLLWPVDRAAMVVDAAVYNEELSGSRARVEDFSAQHLRLNQRNGEPFWDAARAAPISNALAAKIELFAARGMFAHFNHEAHVQDAWAQCMTGHGILPRSSDPQVWRTDEQALMAEFQRQLGAIASSVRSFETHPQALARLARPQ